MIALLLLVGLIGTTPATVFADGPLTLGIESGILATSLVMAALSLSTADGSFLPGPPRFLTILALAPILLMVIQVVPLPSALAISNPIWESVGKALGQPIMGSISIDTGATLLSLCAYLTWLAVGLLAGVLWAQRSDVDWVLFIATLATMTVALLLILSDAGGLSWIGAGPSHIAREAALDASVIGVILSAAYAAWVFQRVEVRREKYGLRGLLLSLAVPAAALMLCFIAITSKGSDNTRFAAYAGLATIIGLIGLRRLGLGPLGGLAVAIVAFTLTEWVVAWKIGHSDSDITLRFSPSSPSSAAAARMLADSTWTGTGAGTYRDLVSIYREVPGVNDFTAPTAAVKIAVEWGRPLLWIGIVAVVTLIVLLLMAALRRRRDTLYPAAGAGLLVALLISAFGNAGLFSSAVLIPSAAMLGLALAQTRGRYNY